MEKTIFDNQNENQWCPGCGNFNIVSAMKKAFIKIGLTPETLLIVSGIGQAGKTPNFMSCNMLHGLHGRALPLATGAKIANRDLNIVVNSGDGDCYGEGGNHFYSAIRRNIDITLLVHNNRVYGLTKGQASPTTDSKMKTKIQKDGPSSSPVNPIASALTAGAGFVAQGFSGNMEQLSRLIVEAVAYKGLSIIDILQPCVSFNKVNTHNWYKERVIDLNEKGHDPSDYKKALDVAHPEGDQIPTGIIFKKEQHPFHERIPVLKKKPLISYEFVKEDVEDLISKAM